MAMCECDQWSGCLLLQTAWVASCCRVANDAGDFDFEEPRPIQVYSEISTSHVNQTDGDTNLDSYMLITDCPMQPGDRVWLAPDDPCECDAREVTRVSPCYDPMCGKIHHYEVMI